MAKQLNQEVNLSFTADVGQAKAQLKDLKDSLSRLSAEVSGNSSLGLTEDLSSAVVECNKLQIALKNATTNTGTLDLGKFQSELEKGNLSVQKIATTLTNLGPAGYHAFSQLTKSVSTAEIPLKRTNALLSNFAETFKATAKWQISSSLYQNAIGAISSAYGYAQDLNESLNNIRVVTGQSSEEMAEFAQQANEAAKALSTTTTAYTDAALIFYQQGLSGDAVTERTDAVIKMANVTGESADEVSSYMTAIWNNFDDGSQSLEHYADVITSLGAHTASSSEEIAEGLEKFASIGSTVGLSYEYATSALATVVAQTRQSADTVGTAFKTLFARIQDLELGDTLDDGTTLGTYSQALETIGVNIKDANGEVKDMNDILDEMGAKWDTIDKGTQIAVAQAVAGTRQYTQLVALMDNWSTFQENVNYANTSDGSLQEQADIYAESWEAAQKRVKASLQGIFDQLLDDDFFISLTDGFADFLDVLKNAIDAIGGLKGVLPLLGTLMLKTFGPDISNSISNIGYNIKLMSKSGRDEIIKTRTEFINSFREMTDDATIAGSARQDVYEGQASVQETLLQKTIELEAANNRLTEDEQSLLNKMMDVNDALGQQYEEQGKIKQAVKETTEQLEAQLRLRVNAANDKAAYPEERYNTYNDDISLVEKYQEQYAAGTRVVESFRQELGKLGSDSSGLDKLKESVTHMVAGLDETATDFSLFREEIQSLSSVTSIEDFEIELNGLEEKISNIGADAEDYIRVIISELTDLSMSEEEATNYLTNLQNTFQRLGESEFNLTTASNSYRNSVRKTNEEIQKAQGKIPDLTDKIMAFGNAMMSISMMFSSIGGIIDTLQDPDLSAWDKFLAVLSAMGMILPSVVMSIKSISSLMPVVTVETEGATAAQWGFNAALDANPLGVVLLALTAVVGVISLFVSLVNKASKAAEELEEGLGQAAEELAQRYEDLAIAAQTFKDAVSDYGDAIDELDSLTKGTEDYKSALEEANSAAKELLDTYGNLDYSIKDGVITIDEDSLEKAQKALEDKESQTQKSSAELSIMNSGVEYQSTLDEAVEGYSNTSLKGGLDIGEVTDEELTLILKEIQQIEDIAKSSDNVTIDNADDLVDAIRGDSNSYLKDSSINYESIIKENFDKLQSAAGIVEYSGTEFQLNPSGEDLSKLYAEIRRLQNITGETFDSAEELKTAIENDGDSLIKNTSVVDSLDALLTNDTFDSVMEMVQATTEVSDAMKEKAKEILSVDVASKYESEYTDTATNEKGVTDEALVSQMEAAVVQFYDSDGLAEKIGKASEELTEDTSKYSNADALNKNYEYDIKSNSDEDIAMAYAEHVLKEDKDQIAWSDGKVVNTDTGDTVVDTDDLTSDVMRLAMARIGEADIATAVWEEEHNPDSFNDSMEKMVSSSQLSDNFTMGILNSLASDDMYDFDFSEAFKDVSLGEVEEMKKLDSDELLDLLGLNKKDLENLGYASAFDFQTSWMAAMEEWDPSTYVEGLKEKITSASDIIGTLQDGGELSDEQLASLNSLEEKYEELGAIQDKNSTEYLNYLIAIRGALEEEEIATEKIAENDAIDDIINIDAVNSDIDDITNKLVDLCEQDYQILVDVKSNIQDEFDTAEDAIQDITDATSLIGENFVVAADDIEELNDAFPGILENSVDLLDGTRQLDSEIVASAQEAAKAEVAADTDATAIKLENQAEELQARADAAGVIASIAQNVIGSAQLSTTQESALDNALNTLKEENSETASTQQSNDMLATADTAASSAQSMVQSFGDAYETMQQDAVTWAGTAKEAIMYATGESDSLPTVGTINGSSKTISSTATATESEDAGDLSDDAGDYSNEDWQEVERYYKQLQKAYEEAANNAKGKATELRTKGNGAIDSIDNTGKGNGSSGSSSEGDTKDYLDLLDEEPELYHEIKMAIDEVETSLSKLDKTQNHLAGGELVNSLKQENELLEKQSKNYKVLNDQIRARQSYIDGTGLKGKKKGQLEKFGISTEDYDTVFQNIEDAYNKQVKAYNKKLAKYNSLASDKEAQEAYEETLNKAKDKLDDQKEIYDKRIDLLEEYYENKQTLEENEEEQQELLYEQIENNLEAYEVEIELKLDTADAEKTLKQFLKNMKTDITKSTKSLAEWASSFELDSTNMTADSSTVDTHLEQLNTYNAATAVGQSDSLFASESERLQAVIDVQKQLLEDADTAYSDYQTANSDFLDAFGAYIDSLDDVIEGFSKISDKIDHYQKMNELLNGDTVEAKQNAAQGYDWEKSNLKAEKEALEIEKARLEALRNEATTTGGYAKDSDYVKQIQEQIDAADSKLQTTIEEYIQTAKDELDNAISMYQQELDTSVWGGKSLDDIQQEWDDKKMLAEGYYDEVERIYELESLESKWKSAINSTSSLKNQQQLKALMEAQVSALEDKTALSEEDVALAEKEIEVYKAQMALEDARNSKNSMKLTRDASGNWSYQYVADEDEVAEKQEDYLEKMNSWRSSAIEATESVEESIMSAYSDFSERMSKIMSDTTLSDEERATKISELNETYWGENGYITKAVEESNYLQNDANKATYEELFALYTENPENYERMTEAEQAIINSFKDAGIESYQELNDAVVGNGDGTGNGMIDEQIKAVNNTSAAWSSLASGIIEEWTGEGKDAVAKKITDAYEKMESAVAIYSTSVTGYWESIVSETSDAVKDTGSLLENMETLTDESHIKALEDYANQVKVIKEYWETIASKVATATSSLSSNQATLANTTETSGGSEQGSEASSNTYSLNCNGTTIDGFEKGKQYVIIYSSGDDDKAKYIKYVDYGTIKSDHKKYNSDEYGFQYVSADGVQGGILHRDSFKKNYKKFDTGGYTGEWNSGEGKLALLHSKEIVLNASDTENILTAVSAIRDIASLGSLSNSITNGVSSLVKNMLNFSGITGDYSSDSSTTEGNTFNITAEFPNANNVDDIREAILSLPTLASQYLSRNKK